LHRTASPRTPRRTSRWLLFGCGFALAACLGTRVPRSDWPPADFFLEVRARRQTETGLIERQSLHVYADGYVVYREADPQDAFPGDWPPVFSRVSAYRLLPQSTRTLARGLYEAGLFQVDTVVGTDVDAEDVVAVRWRAFGEERRAVGRGRVYGPFIASLHCINAFLPPGCAFTLPDMTGEPQPPRISGAPAPLRSVEGAYRLHQDWARRDEDHDMQWQIEFYALAVRAGDGSGARRLLAAIERAGTEQDSPFPDRDAGVRVSLSRLRALLP